MPCFYSFWAGLKREARILAGEWKPFLAGKPYVKAHPMVRFKGSMKNADFSGLPNFKADTHGMTNLLGPEHQGRVPLGFPSEPTNCPDKFEKEAKIQKARAAPYVKAHPM